MHAARVEIAYDQGSLGSRPISETFKICPTKTGQTVPDAVADWIRPMCPSRTLESCVYTFNSAEHGSGRLDVTISGGIYRDRLDDLVLIMEVERAVGQREPARLADSPAWQYGIRLQVRNPYLQVLFGLLFVSGGLGPFLIPSPRSESTQLDPILVLSVLLIVFGFYLWVLRGLRRLRWWHRARAVVKRSGEKMPEDLRIIS